MNSSRDSKGAVVRVSTKDYPLGVVKYAAFALTDEAYVRLEPAKNGVRVELTPKIPAPGSLKRLSSRFGDELDLEQIRSKIESNNRSLREHVIRMALSGETSPPPVEAEIALTDEQQKELDRLIAEVEEEIKKESGASGGDPLGVTQTWEEAHGHDRASK